MKHHVILIPFHNAGHTPASFLLKRGIPLKIISERLGNSQPNFTRNSTLYYLDMMRGVKS
jgi:integrase